MSQVTKNWETLRTNEGELCRLRVHGGWLMKVKDDVQDKDENWAGQMSVVFVPDPDHEWQTIELITNDNN